MFSLASYHSLETLASRDLVVLFVHLYFHNLHILKTYLAFCKYKIISLELQNLYMIIRNVLIENLSKNCGLEVCFGK